MALRSLMIELGLTDNVTNRLRGIDSQIDGIEGGVADTQKEFGALEKATQEYGHTARQEIDGVGKDVSELDKQVDQHAETTEKATDKAEKAWAKLGAAIGGAALATEAFIRTQQDHYVTAEGIGYITGMTQQEVVKLAGSLIDLSTTQTDAFGLLHAGARQGLRDAEDLAEYTQFWSNIGTAAREDSVALAEAGVSLRSVGIEAQDLTDHYDTFGFIMSKTTGTVSEFLRLTGYMAKDMDSYGMEISDVAVLLAALEEKGMGAADAKRALRSAMGAAKGDAMLLYRELGITEDHLSRLNSEVNQSASYVEMMGEAFDSSRTPLQRLQTQASKFATTLGFDLAPALGGASAVLSTLSTILITAAGAKFLLATTTTAALVPSLAAATTSAWAFTAALLANPITWLVVGVIGLISALYILHTRWDDISGWFMDRWDATAGVVTGAMDWIGGAWDSTVGSIIAGAEWLGDKLQYLMLLNPFTAPIAGMNLLRDNWDTVTGAIAGGWDWFVGAAQDGAAWLGETIGAGLSGIIDLFWQYHPLGIVIRQWDEITGYLEGIDLVETGRDILLGLVRGILDIRQQAIDAVMGIGEDILNAVTGFFGISSPSRLMQEMGGRVGEGFALGVAQSMPDSIPLPDAIEGSIPPGPVRGGYATVWTEPAVSSLAGEAVYSSTLTEPVVEDLAGNVAYSSVLTEPVVGDLTGRVVYSSTLTEPVVEDLTGAITYLSTVIKPVVSELTGNLTYESRVSEPTIVDRTGTVVYEPEVPEPTISNTLTGEVEYHSVFEPPTVEPIGQQVLYSTAFDEPTVRDLTGTVTYLSTVSEPIVPEISEEVTYSTTVSEPALSPLEGSAIWYSRVTEPTIKPLTGSVQYSSVIAGPDVPALTGDLTYETRVSEPTIVDRAGTVVYETEVSEPTVGDLAGVAVYRGVVDEQPTLSDLAGVARYSSVIEDAGIHDLTGRVTYTSQVTEPMIDGLTGEVTYHPSLGVPTVSDLEGNVIYILQVSRLTVDDLQGDVIYAGSIVEPVVPSLTGDITYETTLSEPGAPAIDDQIAYLTYTSRATEPAFSDLEGEARYHGIVLDPDVPDVYGVARYHSAIENDLSLPDRQGEYLVTLPQIDDTHLSWSPETDSPHQLRGYTPEKDGGRISGETNYGDIVFSPNITVTTSGGDAREIATAVDRRLRQTFDRHANIYFGRQRRRAGG